MLHKLGILLTSLYGHCLKWLYDLHILHVPTLGERAQANVIVSLTSYGRRVQKGVVCYSIYSILRQTVQPQQIVLWLSKDEWNADNLPQRLKDLQTKGVQVRFCEDMRSYKKLLPALAAYPEQRIVTVDDDVLYPATLLSDVLAVADRHPNTIVAGKLRDATLDKPYTQWKEVSPDMASVWLLPLGVSGVLYPAHCLHSDFLDYERAKQYAPLADDIWFWAAGIAQGTKKTGLGKMYRYVSFDAIYQYFHTGSSLQSANVKGRGELTNDDQIARTAPLLGVKFNTPY